MIFKNIMNYFCNYGSILYRVLEAALVFAMAKSSTSGLVDTGFASRYWLQPRAVY